MKLILAFIFFSKKFLQNDTKKKNWNNKEDKKREREKKKRKKERKMDDWLYQFNVWGEKKRMKISCKQQTITIYYL